jgi:hypothetical protein
MHRLIAVFAVVVAALAVGLPMAPATTVPGVVYPIKVVVTDTKISIQKDKFDRNGQIRYPRGAEIRYEITNRGSKPYVLEIWGARSIALRPHGGHDSILVTWNYRGRYLYRLLLHSRPVGPKGWIVIF